MRRLAPLLPGSVVVNAETVFSHPSKLDLIDRAQRADYVVVLHVILVPENLAVARVAERVIEGGHRVPETKIRERFARLWPLVAEAITRVDHTTVYDNTAAEVTRIVARFVEGDPVGEITWPTWAPAELTDRWARFGFTPGGVSCRPRWCRVTPPSSPIA